jgi:hypothetical protein
LELAYYDEQGNEYASPMIVQKNRTYRSFYLTRMAPNKEELIKTEGRLIREKGE